MATQAYPYPVEDTQTVISELNELKKAFEQKHLTALFAENAERFDDFSVNADPIVFDFSKHRIDQKVLKTLVRWAYAQDLKPWIKRLFSTQKVNCTENRSAMHWALRLPKNDQDHPAIAQQVHEQFQRMFTLVRKIHDGQCRGATGEVIQDVVNMA